METTTQKKVPKFYLAGPFFNPQQIQLMQDIEVAFVDHMVPFVSPRLQDDNKPGEITTEVASRIFRRNVQDLDECSAMLAVLDWKIPKGYALQVTHQSDSSHPRIPISGPLQLPDTGTVFEMGLATGMAERRALPIIGFTEQGSGGTLNVMLTQACRGIIHGLEDLKLFLNKGDLRWELPKPWVGQNQ